MANLQIAVKKKYPELLKEHYLSKCSVDCPVHQKDKREFEITPEGRVWPCCYYANAWEKRSSLVSKQDGYSEALTLLKDPICEVMKKDPNFNHLVSMT